MNEPQDKKWKKMTAIVTHLEKEYGVAMQTIAMYMLSMENEKQVNAIDDEIKRIEQKPLNKKQKLQQIHDMFEYMRGLNAITQIFNMTDEK